MFSFRARAESYTSRQVLTQFEGAENDLLGDMLWTAMIKDFQPSRLVDFRFSERPLRSIRLVETARAKTGQWDVSEISIYDQDRELPRDSQWRLGASPNPWNVEMAFDKTPVTRWRSWEPARPGMFIKVDFSLPRTLDRVRIETVENAETKMRLEGMDASGHWAVLNDQPAETIRPLPINLRRSATEQLKARGVRFILIDSSDYGATDFFQHPADWGLREAGSVAPTRLYHIE